MSKGTLPRGHAALTLVVVADSLAAAAVDGVHLNGRHAAGQHHQGAELLPGERAAEQNAREQGRREVLRLVGQLEDRRVQVRHGDVERVVLAGVLVRKVD